MSNNEYVPQAERVCWLCGGGSGLETLDVHHIYGGPFRKKSEKYGLVVYLHHNNCHIFGPNSAHQNRETMLKIKRYGQRIAMETNGWSTDDFIREFGKNYL